jgi:hypothetical protein
MADIMKMGKNPNYLGAWDLDESPNKEIVLTIAKIVDEMVTGAEGRSENNTVCYWTDGAFKPMILNVTNKKTICKLYKTKDTEKFKGKAVLIGTEKVKAFGDVYEALRIRPRIPQIENKELPKCDKCGADIEPFGKMSADQVAAYRVKKYGAALCNECAKSAAEDKAE